MRDNWSWGILGYGLIGMAVKTQRFFYIFALNDMLAKYDLKYMYMELLGSGRCKGENTEIFSKGGAGLQE